LQLATPNTGTGDEDAADDIPPIIELLPLPDSAYEDIYFY